MKPTSFPYNTAFVVNPYAGKGRGAKTWKKIGSYLEKNRIAHEVYFTGDGGDGRKMAERASRDGAELIVAVGGDGTLQEVANGIDREKNIFGVIGAGTANGFRRSVAVPHNPMQSLKGLFEWPVLEMDLGMVNDKIFLNSVGMGYDAAVSKTATDDNYWLEGYPAYVSACLQHLYIKPRVVTFQLDNGQIITRETILIVVANGKFYGGQLCIAPQAIVDDGFLDFQLVEDIDKFRMISMGLLAFFKAHTGIKGFHKTRVKEAVINCDDDTMLVQVDGETRDNIQFPLKFTVLEKALKIISPLNLHVEKQSESERRQRLSREFFGV